ncbi:Retrovirus-related Pol polyprotein from transposon opus [Thelohanellus kitauei]|uniref:Retrovirus-related Pol polyprotein from transposon opus n=1 Tax=Thelohanellus kitauei TaxID=669202 RepID=A0A0C2JQZ9_THEKT|nr:Retrovirus-related Pol polyprotein from transposon opus [Thelohanellus kitauei]
MVLCELTLQRSKYIWLECHDYAFHGIKQQLAKARLLEFPCNGDTYILDCDASEKGFGAVLSQTNNKRAERVLQFASRVLSKEEQRYSTTRKELAAFICGLTNFNPYLLGTHRIIRSDHKPLGWLLWTKDAEGQLVRRLDLISQINVELVYRDNVKHGNSDGMCG